MVGRGEGGVNKRAKENGVISCEFRVNWLEWDECM